MKLSLCLAVRNEEKNIHYPLDSACNLADEIIVVDGDSNDRTIEIARSYGKKVSIIHAKNETMFHRNKQKAIEAASGEWILQLDADEALTDSLKEEIRTIVYSKNSLVGYWLPRKNFFLTRFLTKGGQYPDYTLRLYKKGMAKFPCQDVHENVRISGKMGYLKNPLLHFADPDFSRYLMRWDRYTSLEVERMPKGQNLSFFKYFCWYPKITFLSMYFRHKGFMDGFPGFVFALFSSMRFIVIYIKWWTSKHKIKH